MSELAGLAAVALNFGVSTEDALTIAREASKEYSAEAAYLEAARLAQEHIKNRPLPAEDEAMLADLRLNAGNDAADIVEASLRAKR